MKPWLVLAGPATLLLAACGGNDPATSDTTTIPRPATTVTAAQGSVASTATQPAMTMPTTTVPATMPETTVPETTAAPAPTTAADVLANLTDAGLPIGTSVVWTPDTDPNKLLGRPGNYINKATWIDERVASECPDGEPDWACGGDIELFDDPQALTTRFDYLGTFASNFPGGYYMWRTDTAIVRVGFALTPDDAAGYEAQLRAMFPTVEAFAG